MRRNHAVVLGAGLLVVAQVAAAGPASASTSSAVVAPTVVRAAALGAVVPAIPNDFNGDGVVDLASGAPNADDNGRGHTAGAVFVFYGDGPGTEPQPQTLSPLAATLSSPAAELVGYALASGDFDRDGFADLAMGAPAYDLNGTTKVNCGGVLVVYGSPTGLNTTSSRHFQVITQDSAGVLGGAEGDDAFGTSLASGDFDADGYADLVVGVPGETLGAGEQWQGSSNVLYGGTAGLSGTDDQAWNQNSPSVYGVSEFSDRMAESMAVGDFDGDGADDLALGVPSEDVGSLSNAGAVNVLYGRKGYGLGPSRNVQLTQSSVGIAGTPEAKDAFGWGLAAGDSNGDGRDDLAIGSPTEQVGDRVEDGMVTIIPGSAKGLDPTASTTLTSTPVLGYSRGRIGTALVFGDVDADGFDELVVGVPGNNSVLVVPGSPTGAQLPLANPIFSGNWALPTASPGFVGRILWLSDFDGKPGADLVLGDTGAYATSNPGGVGGLWVLPSDGAAFVAAPTILTESDVAGRVPAHDWFGGAVSASRP